MKKQVLVLLLGFQLCIPPAFGELTPSEASGVSVLVTASLVVAVSSIPFLALSSIGEASVKSVKPAGNNHKDITVCEKETGKTAVIRVPNKALAGKTVKPGQKAEFQADDNGQMFKVEGQPIAYLPTPDGQQMLRSKKVQ